ncbi:MAG: molybdopterin-guanine dinucleotide biosynthesis protein B [Proteobacteria bacterium]|nr:molybdopterin-guanine dinucleotide biosynthesis protein B [Pseudomonadota bacterium]
MDIETKVPVLGFAAYSGTGKTTLLVNLIPLLKQQGIEVGVIKHAHHTFEIDQPGKDSYEIRKAGAKQMLIGSKKRWALMVEQEEKNLKDRLQEYISHIDQDKLDLILVEGFKPEAIPKIELHRPDLGYPLICKTDDSVIAIATDADINGETELPLLDLNDYDAMVKYIMETFSLSKKTVANSGS